jgi:hypothetical protein
MSIGNFRKDINSQKGRVRLNFIIRLILARCSSSSTLQCVCVFRNEVKSVKDIDVKDSKDLDVEVAKDLDVADGIPLDTAVMVFNAFAFRLSNTGPLVSLKNIAIVSINIPLMIN